MALQLIGGLIDFPPTHGWTGGISLLTSSFTCTAADHKVAMVFKVKESKSIRRIHFRTGTVTTGATLDIRVETVSLADGNPSGTLWATNTNVSHVLNSTDDNVWITSANLTADASVSAGDLLAIVIANPSASPGDFQIGNFSDEFHDEFPYGGLFTASWSKTTAMPIIAVEFSDGTFATIFSHIPASAVNTVAFNNASTPDERGCRFILPFKTRAVGTWFVCNAIGGNVPFDVVLYGTDNSVLATASHDGDVQRGVGVPGLFRLMFPTPAVIDANTTNPYRIVLKPTSASNVSLVDMDFASTALLDAIPGGAGFHHTERADAGSWSNTSTKRDMIGLILDSL